MTVQSRTTSPLVCRDLLDANGFAETVADGLQTLLANLVMGLYEQDLAATGIQPKPTRQDILIVQLRVFKALGEVRELLQDNLLDEGKSIGMSDARMAEPLRMTSAAVSWRRARRASRLGK